MRIEREIKEDIRRHGGDAYPEEGCGFLLGHFSAEGGHLVTLLEPANNVRSENRERRYTISPEDYRKADRTARERGLDIVGFYHSHPDHPARPSETDLQEATFPGFVYMILSVRHGQPAELTAWTLADDRSRFNPEEIDILEANRNTT